MNNDNVEIQESNNESSPEPIINQETQGKLSASDLKKEGYPDDFIKQGIALGDVFEDQEKKTEEPTEEPTEESKEEVESTDKKEEDGLDEKAQKPTTGKGKRGTSKLSDIRKHRVRAQVAESRLQETSLLKNQAEEKIKELEQEKQELIEKHRNAIKNKSKKNQEFDEDFLDSDETEESDNDIPKEDKPLTLKELNKIKEKERNDKELEKKKQENYHAINNSYLDLQKEEANENYGNKNVEDAMETADNFLAVASDVSKQLGAGVGDSELAPAIIDEFVDKFSFNRKQASKMKGLVIKLVETFGKAEQVSRNEEDSVFDIMMDIKDLSKSGKVIPPIPASRVNRPANKNGLKYTQKEVEESTSGTGRVPSASISTENTSRAISYDDMSDEELVEAFSQGNKYAKFIAEHGTMNKTARRFMRAYSN